MDQDRESYTGKAPAVDFPKRDIAAPLWDYRSTKTKIDAYFIKKAETYQNRQEYLANIRYTLNRLYDGFFDPSTATPMDYRLQHIPKGLCSTRDTEGDIRCQKNFEKLVTKIGKNRSKLVLPALKGDGMSDAVAQKSAYFGNVQSQESGQTRQREGESFAHSQSAMMKGKNAASASSQKIKSKSRTRGPTSRQSEQPEIEKDPAWLIALLEDPEAKFRLTPPEYLQCRTLDDLSFITWLHDRLEGSCRAFRFELPSDLKQLENLDVKTYLLKYCVIPPARQLNYNMAYKKFKNKHTGTIPMKDAFTAVNSLLADSLETTDLQRLFTLLKISNLNELDLRIFSVTTAVAERILYNTIIGNYGRSGLNRSYLECADFFNLAWKLEGINVHPQLKKVLISIG